MSQDWSDVVWAGQAAAPGLEQPVFTLLDGDEPAHSPCCFDDVLTAIVTHDCETPDELQLCVTGWPSAPLLPVLLSEEPLPGLSSVAPSCAYDFLPQVRAGGARVAAGQPFYAARAAVTHAARAGGGRHLAPFVAASYAAVFV